MKKYVENMEEYVENMKEYGEIISIYWIWHSHIGYGTCKNSKLFPLRGFGAKKNSELLFPYRLWDLEKL